MKINEIYPKVEKKVELKKNIYNILRFAFMSTSLLCFVLNLITGGKMWSLLVIWSLWLIWNQFIAIDMIEYNRMSQIVKIVLNSSILLIIIDRFIISGWAIEVVPIVCFCGIILIGILLFSDFDRQKHNTFPVIIICLLCIISAIIGLSVWKEETRWALALMGTFASILLFIYVSKQGIDFINELKKIFSIK